VEKLLAAREAAVAKGDYDFIINARTDALRAFPSRNEGLHEAISRANHYLNAGADLAFICYTATLEEAKTLAREVHGPISIAAGQPYNIGEFCIDDLRMLGIARVSLPTLAILSAIDGMANALALISEPDGFTRIIEGGFAPHENLWRNCSGCDNRRAEGQVPRSVLRSENPAPQYSKVPAV
jgi:2-methylisocitrate lyase-like PEP mutase family enzyme